MIEAGRFSASKTPFQIAAQNNVRNSAFPNHQPFPIREYSYSYDTCTSILAVWYGTMGFEVLLRNLWEFEIWLRNLWKFEILYRNLWVCV